MSFIQSLQTRAAALGRTIVLPETEDDRVLTAAAIIRERGIAQVILLLSLIHISEPTRQRRKSRMPSSA